MHCGQWWQLYNVGVYWQSPSVPQLQHFEHLVHVIREQCQTKERFCHIPKEKGHASFYFEHNPGTGAQSIVEIKE